MSTIYGESVIVGKITPVAQISARITAETSPITAKLSGGIIPKIYTGEYEITPSEEQQTIEIHGMLAAQNITIDAIPSNYGRVTQVGSILVIT